MRKRLGVNIDHIATIRESRKVSYPDPYLSLSILKELQVDQVTIHLREDRRHIQDHDLNKIVRANHVPVNLEMSNTEEMIVIASKAKPKNVTFVPEKREEITTEGGLDCVKFLQKLSRAVAQLKSEEITVSHFIEPEIDQVLAAKETGAEAIEIHTGTYCNILEEFFHKAGHYDYHQSADYKIRVENEISKIKTAAIKANEIHLKVFAGHGLHTGNLAPIVAIDLIEEYNIGHAIIARAVFVGLKQAIIEIQEQLKKI